MHKLKLQQDVFGLNGDSYEPTPFLAGELSDDDLAKKDTKESDAK